MPERPPTEPTFTDTMQIGIVVPDLDVAIRTYRGVEVDSLSTERDLGVILEVFIGMPKKQAEERLAHRMLVKVLQCWLDPLAG